MNLYPNYPDERPFIRNISRRELLKLLGVTGASLALECISPVPNSPAKVEAQEDDDIFFPYEIDSAVFNQLGVLEFDLNDCDPRMFTTTEETESGAFLTNYDYAKFAPTNPVNPFSTKLLQATLDALEDRNIDIGEFNGILFAPIQDFPLPDGKTASLPYAFSPTSELLECLPTLMGGIFNGNISALYKADNTYGLGPEVMLQTTIAHEISHMRGAKFPLTIEVNGEEIPFSHDGIHILGLNPDQPGISYVQPGNGGTIAPSEYGNEYEKMKRISPVELFILGLMTKEEFTNSFENGKPTVIKFDNTSPIRKRSVIEYSVEDLISAIEKPGNSYGGRSVAQIINQIQTGGNFPDTSEPASFTPGYNKNIDGSPYRIGIIPSMIFAKDKRLSEDVADSEMLLRVLESIASYWTQNSYGCLEVVVVNGQ